METEIGKRFYTYIISHPSFLNVFYKGCHYYTLLQKLMLKIYQETLFNSIVKVRRIDTSASKVQTVHNVNFFHVMLLWVANFFNYKVKLLYSWIPPDSDNHSPHIFYELTFADHTDKVILKHNEPFTVPSDLDRTNQMSILCVELKLNDSIDDVTKFFDLYRHSFVSRSTFSVLHFASLYMLLWKQKPLPKQCDISMVVVKGDALDETIYKDTDIILL